MTVLGSFFPSLSGPSQSSYNKEGPGSSGRGERKEPWIVFKVKRPGVSELLRYLVENEKKLGLRERSQEPFFSSL